MKIIVHVLEIKSLTKFNFSYGNIFYLFGGEVCDIFAIPFFSTLLVWNILNGYALDESV